MLWKYYQICVSPEASIYAEWSGSSGGNCYGWFRVIPEKLSELLDFPLAATP